MTIIFHRNQADGRSPITSRRRPLPAPGLMLLAVLMFAAPMSKAATERELVIKGSDTMVILCQKWAERFMAAHPGTQIQVSGGGSGTGVAALLNRATDIAASSRPMKPKEIAEFVVKVGAKPTETKAALDGISVYVNAANPVKELSLDQLRRIYTGEITNWADVGGRSAPILLYSRENNSGTYVFFKEHVLKEADFSARAQAMVGTASLVNAVEKDPNAIGYGGIGYLSKLVHMVAVRAKDGEPAYLAEMGNVVSGVYPISRYLFLYSSPLNDNPRTKQFLDWVAGPEGQQIVNEVGYFPLPGVLPDAPVVAAAPVVVTPSSPAPVVPTAPVIAAPALVQREQDLLERERNVAVREAALAKREEAIAERELRLIDRQQAQR